MRWGTMGLGWGAKSSAALSLGDKDSFKHLEDDNLKTVS